MPKSVVEYFYAQMVCNLGVGDISKNREEAKNYYTKIGNMAKEKGIVINLITFEDSESEIEVLMNMVKIQEEK